MRHGPPTACRHAVSGTISLPSQGFFSPFPHGTSSLSVANEYLALPDGPGRFPQGFSCPAVLRSHLKLRLHFQIQGCHLLWPAFPDRSTKILIFNLPTAPYRRQTKPYNTTATTHTGLTSLWFGLFPFRSPLLGESRLISIPAGTEMFHFPAWASRVL